MWDLVFEQLARQFLSAIAKDLDPYTSEKSEIVITNDNEIVLLTPSHIHFAKYGRGPGKRPPLDPLLEWVKKGRFQFRDAKGRFQSYKGTAFAIQASIAKKGTSNWVPGAPNAMVEAINANSGEYNKKLNNTIVTEIHDQYNKALEKVFPPKVEIKV